MTTTRSAGVSLLVLAAIGCASGGGTAPQSGEYGFSGGEYGGGGGYYTGTTTVMPAEMDCAATAPKFQEVTAFGKCVHCHASSKTGAQRNGAPPAVNFETQAVAEPSAQGAVNMVKAGAMPPAASGLTLTDAEKTTLYAWAMCGD
jgi:hypothetical protein